jgi:hypothetical protein
MRAKLRPARIHSGTGDHPCFATLLSAAVLGAAGVLAGASIALPILRWKINRRRSASTRPCCDSARLQDPRRWRFRVRVPDGYISEADAQARLEARCRARQISKPMSVRRDESHRRGDRGRSGNLPDLLRRVRLTGYIGDASRQTCTSGRAGAKGINRWIPIPAGDGPGTAGGTSAALGCCRSGEERARSANRCHAPLIGLLARGFGLLVVLVACLELPPPARAHAC